MCDINTDGRFRGICHGGAGARKKSYDRIELRVSWFQISSLRAMWGRDVCGIYTEGRFRGISYRVAGARKRS